MTPNSSIRLIWVTPKFPLGTPDGARHATRVLIRHLTQLDVKVELICLLPSDESATASQAEKDLGTASCSFIRRAKPRLTMPSDLGIPLTFRTFASTKVRHALNHELLRLLAADHRRQTFVLFDGLHPFAALLPEELPALSKRCQGVIYRAHNYETALWEQCIETSRTPWTLWMYRFQAALVKTFERRIAQDVSWVLPVSEDDAERFRQLAPGVRLSVAPIGMDFPPEDTIPLVDTQAKHFELLFVGRLDWLPNKNGLTWFLEKIWPALLKRRPDACLKIAGVGDGTWLQRFQQLPGVQALGRVEDLSVLYQNCAVSLAPLFQGSGTRVKILESARYARPVVSTALGAEGTGLISGRSYYRAENEQEWLETLGTILLEDCRTTGVNAFREARERFDGKSIAQHLIQTLQSPEPPRPFSDDNQPSLLHPDNLYVQAG